jgi:hypothetical protein
MAALLDRCAMLQKVGLFDIANLLWNFLDSTAFQSLAIILVTYWGLTAFRKQHLWTKRAELAEELLVAASDFKQAMDRVRDPTSFGSEGSTRIRLESETGEVPKQLDLLYVTLERLGNEAGVFERLRVADVRARLRFGTKVSKALDRLAECHRNVVIAARMRYRIESRQGDRPRTARDNERMEQRERVIWSTPGEDETGDQIDAAIAELNENLSAYISEGEK